jgi:hypothetical protein
MIQQKDTSSRPLFRDIVKWDRIFPAKEKDLPLAMMARPYNYVVIGRTISLLWLYLKRLAIYSYYKYLPAKKETQ